MCFSSSSLQRPRLLSPPSPGLRSRCSLAGALQPKHLTVAAPGLPTAPQAPHSGCSPQMPSAARSPAAPQAITVAAAPQPLTVAAAQMPSAALSPAAPQALTVAAASQAPHSGCSPRCPQQPLALQPPKPSQSLQPRSSQPPRPLTVAAASRASLLLFSPDPRGWVRTAGGEDRG